MEEITADPVVLYTYPNHLQPQPSKVSSKLTRHKLNSQTLSVRLLSYTHPVCPPSASTKLGVRYIYPQHWEFAASNYLVRLLFSSSRLATGGDRFRPAESREWPGPCTYRSDSDKAAWRCVCVDDPSVRVFSFCISCLIRYLVP